MSKIHKELPPVQYDVKYPPLKAGEISLQEHKQKKSGPIGEFEGKITPAMLNRNVPRENLLGTIKKCVEEGLLSLNAFRKAAYNHEEIETAVKAKYQYYGYDTDKGEFKEGTSFLKKVAYIFSRHTVFGAINKANRQLQKSVTVMPRPAKSGHYLVTSAKNREEKFAVESLLENADRNVMAFIKERDKPRNFPYNVAK
ncbi:MAG TPA: hypothetical protein VLE96_00295 [Chlamydiales bacterium]|nr:hypothetical protein [Chlamydiales bacterium]